MPKQAPADPIIEEWLDGVEWRSAHNIANAISTLNRYVRWCATHDVSLTAATRRDVKAFLAARRDSGIAPSTARTDWRMLRAFYAWAATPVRHGGGGEMRADPMEGIKGPRVPTRPATRAAKPDDIAALEGAFGNDELGRRNAAMVSLMFRSGLRVGELAWLDLAHYTERSDGRAVLFVPVTKTDEPRLVPVHPETQRYLSRYLRRRGRDAGPLFRGSPRRTVDPDGRIKTRAIQDVIGRAGARIGVDVSPHQLRRAFTSQYLRGGGDVLSLEVIGGWADHRMPRRYLADEEATAAVERAFDVMDRQAASARRLRAVR